MYLVGRLVWPASVEKYVSTCITALYSNLLLFYLVVNRKRKVGQACSSEWRDITTPTFLSALSCLRSLELDSPCIPSPSGLSHHNLRHQFQCNRTSEKKEGVSSHNQNLKSHANTPKATQSLLPAPRQRPPPSTLSLRRSSGWPSHIFNIPCLSCEWKRRKDAIDFDAGIPIAAFAALVARAPKARPHV